MQHRKGMRLTHQRQRPPVLRFNRAGHIQRRQSPVPHHLTPFDKKIPHPCRPGQKQRAGVPNCLPPRHRSYPRRRYRPACQPRSAHNRRAPTPRPRHGLRCAMPLVRSSHPHHLRPVAAASPYAPQLPDFLCRCWPNHQRPNRPSHRHPASPAPARYRSRGDSWNRDNVIHRF